MLSTVKRWNRYQPSMAESQRLRARQAHAVPDEKKANQQAGVENRIRGDRTFLGVGAARSRLESCFSR